MNTTIEGILAVGANADVTYRDDNGYLVAIGVRVTPPQSKQCCQWIISWAVENTAEKKY